MYQYAFILGREYKLSLAELGHIFGFSHLKAFSETVALFALDEPLASHQLQHLGGVIRIIEILGDTDPKRFPTDAIAHMHEQHPGGAKITFALGSYGLDYPLSDIGLRVKKTLQQKGHSARIVNTKNCNINAAAFKKEKLGKSRTEYNLIRIPHREDSPTGSNGTPLSRETSSTDAEDTFGDAHYSIGVTIACQDIDAYTRRDIAKNRDMIVGMMPPKLVQMMINIGVHSSDPESSPSGSIQAIYDPFCGLGTTLIEAANMGFSSLYGSDVASDMVASTRASLEAFIAEEKTWQDRIKKAWWVPQKDFANIRYNIWQMDARNIGNRSAQLCTESPESVLIMSEGYLWEIMSPRDITLDRVQSERRKLARMYQAFFQWLTRMPMCNTMIMTFPFWNIHGTHSYFTEIYSIIEENGWKVIPLLPSAWGLNTKKWSLLYRRESQTVGREIIKMIRR